MVNSKGQYLGFREVVRGDDFEKYEMKLAENNMLFNMVSVDAGLIFEKKADIDQLKAALKAIIPKFSKAAGRMVLRDKKIFVICNNQGIPVTHYVKSCPGPTDLKSPIPMDCFDVIEDWNPKKEKEAQAPFKIKVTDFIDGKQIITVSVSHAICDARSIGIFFEAWSAQLNGLEVPDITCDDSWIPEAPEMMQPPLVAVSQMQVSEAWKNSHKPYDGQQKVAAEYDPFMTSYSRS